MVGGLQTAANSVKPKCLQKAQQRHFGCAVGRYAKLLKTIKNILN
jgi:hypothetical protein